MVGFVLLKVDATLASGGGCGIWEHWHSFKKVNVSRVVPRFSFLMLLKKMRTRGQCCKSVELGGRESPRFLFVVIPVVESFSSNFLRAVCNKLLGRVALRVLSNINIGDLSRELPATLSIPIQPVQSTSTGWLILQKRSHCRCFAGIKIRLWLEVLSVWDVEDCKLVYGSCNRRLVCIGK